MIARFGPQPSLCLLGVCLPLFSWGFQPVGPEVEDGYYRDSEALTEGWFSEPEVKLHVPGSADKRWTTVSEAYAFMEQMASMRENLVLREIGESLLGIPILALFHEVDQPGALTVLVQARVHGNEPASTEGALELAYDLAMGELAELDINVILVPVLNPEGARTMARRTGTDIDPNRDYVLHESGCIRAVYRLMREYDPEVVLDMHEHRSYAWPYDLMTIGPNNPNIPVGVREFTDKVIIGEMEAAFGEADLRIGPYRLLDFLDEGVRVRESATTFVSEKNALAMAGRISLLTEGRGIGLGTQHYKRRTLAQYTAARAVVEAAARHEDEIQSLVTHARREIEEGSGNWVLRVDPVEVPAEHEFLDATTDGVVTRPTTYWERTKGTVAATMERPWAYVIHSSQPALADRLRRFGLQLIPVKEAMIVEVEAMTVNAFTKGTDTLYGGQMARKEDGERVRPAVLRNHEIEICTRTVEREIPAGSWIVPAEHPKSLYLITLEPESPTSFAALSYWGSDLPVGFEFPVYRLRAAPASE